MKRPSSSFVRIFFSFLIIIAVLILSIYFFSYRIIRAHHINTLTQNLGKISRSLTGEIKTFILNNELQKIDDYVKKMGEQINTRLTVIAPQGWVLGDSEEDPESMDNHRYREEISQALTGKIGSSLRYSKTLRLEMLYVATPVYHQNEIIGVIRASLFLDEIKILLNDLRREIFNIALIITALSVIGALILSRTFTRPIEKLKQAARKAAQGDFSTRVILKDRTDLKTLADAFNDMTARIERLFGQLKHEKDELNSILSSIDEGLIVIDEQGKICWSTHGFNKLVGQDASGHYYWELLRDEQFSEFFNRIKQNPQHFSEELKWHGKDFLCSVSYTTAKDEVVFVISDISDIKKLEKVKKDFVSNVSHELRTPLTAIKGFVETLIEEEPNEERKRYLNIIQRHTDRLINIVKDLLMLSKLEKASRKLEPEKVYLQELLDDLTKMVMAKIEEKELDFIVDIDPDVSPIKGDRYKLEQMFINLIDNAIKYTDKGQISINISHLNHKICIQVSDTGIGIPIMHIPRIFERFYVVDKSRSRKAGGTGLGLSIVKHIVLLHNGNIEVESLPGGGTTFIIELPQ